MDGSELRDVLKEVADGRMSVDDAVLRLKREPFDDIGYAKVDTHRGMRQGALEVIFGAGKTPEQIAGIAARMVDAGETPVLITRMSSEAAELVGGMLPLKYDELSRVGIIGTPRENSIGKITVITAGTSDIPVAEEAALTAEVLGNNVVRVYDVGVSGIHRLLAHTDDVMTSKVIVAVAGMEGALASVVGGMADCPVVAVPTSVGYGASFGGLAVLLAMLNSCASGVSVVNIDNGFGAGYFASMINRASSKI